MQTNCRLTFMHYGKTADRDESEKVDTIKDTQKRILKGQEREIKRNVIMKLYDSFNISIRSVVPVVSLPSKPAIIRIADEPMRDMTGTMTTHHDIEAPMRTNEVLKEQQTQTMLE